MTPTTSVLIGWDIDGTLINPRTWPVGGRTTHYQAVETTLDRPCDAPLPPSGSTDRAIIAALLEGMGAHPEALADAMATLDDQVGLAADPARGLHPPPGVVDALARCASAGHVNALLTGNTPLRARAKLAAAGYALDDFDWDRSAFGDQTLIRADLAIALVVHAIDSDLAVAMVGDTPRDAEAAAAIGVPFCAVATGAHTAAELAEHPHDLVLADLDTGADQLLEFLASLTTKPT